MRIEKFQQNFKIMKENVKRRDAWLPREEKRINLKREWGNKEKKKCVLDREITFSRYERNIFSPVDGFWKIEAWDSLLWSESMSESIGLVGDLKWRKDVKVKMKRLKERKDLSKSNSTYSWSISELEGEKRCWRDFHKISLSSFVSSANRRKRATASRLIECVG